MTTFLRLVRIAFGFLLAGLASAALVYSGFAPAPPVPEKLMLFVGRFHPLMVHLPIGFLAAIAALRSGASDAELQELLGGVWRARTDRYSELRAEQRPHATQKVEMFHVGG